MDQAEANAEMIMPGYTHLQHAQPVLLGHHLMAYFWMLQRDKGRMLDCLKRIDVCPLGSGALAGTTIPNRPRVPSDELGLRRLPRTAWTRSPTGTSSPSFSRLRRY